MTNIRGWLAGCLVLLMGWVAANSVLGPLFLEVIEYRYDETMINQGIGLDAVALFAAAPIALLAALLVASGHRAGPVLAFVPASFAAYMAPQYVIGPDYMGIAGNNEVWLLFHLGLFVLAVATLLLAWRTVDRSGLRPASPDSDRRRSWVLFGVATFIAIGRWAPVIALLMQGELSSAEYTENPTAFFLIAFLDLGVVVPAAIAAGLGLRFGAGWARTAAYAVIGWFALVPAAIGSMAVVMEVNDDPNAATTTTVMFVIAAVVFTLGAAVLYRPMFGRASTSPGQEIEPAGREPARLG